MSVQELINELQKIEDKTKQIWVYSFDEYSPPEVVIEDDADVGKDTVLIV